MPGPRPWKTTRIEPLHDCRVFRVSRMHVRSPNDGDVHPFYRIDAEDWVNVVPLTPDDQIVMVRQYRHGARELTLEIPGGIVDPGESPEAAAARELLEETGYRAERLEPIGQVNPNPAVFGNRVHTFWAHDAVCVGPVRNEGHEETSVELIPLDELRDQLRVGAIDHALVMAALLWFDLARQPEV